MACVRLLADNITTARREKVVRTLSKTDDDHGFARNRSDCGRDTTYPETWTLKYRRIALISLVQFPSLCALDALPSRAFFFRGTFPVEPGAR